MKDVKDFIEKMEKENEERTFPDPWVVANSLTILKEYTYSQRVEFKYYNYNDAFETFIKVKEHMKEVLEYVASENTSNETTIRFNTTLDYFADNMKSLFNTYADEKNSLFIHVSVSNVIDGRVRARIDIYTRAIIFETTCGHHTDERGERKPGFIKSIALEGHVFNITPSKLYIKE